MKRAWVRAAVAAGVVVLGLYAIALAQRGSITTSQAASPSKGDRPRFVRPDTPPSGPKPLTGGAILPATTSSEAAKSSLSLREPQPLPNNPQARPLNEARFPESPAANDRYVTQQDVRDYRLQNSPPYAGRYDEYRRAQADGRTQQVGYEGEPSSAAGAAALPANLPTLAPPLVGDAPTTLPHPSTSTTAVVSDVPNPLPPGANTSSPLSPPNRAPQGVASTPSPIASSAGTNVPTGTGKPGAKTLEGPQTPSLVVEKLAPPETQVGKPAKFAITVRNVGAAAAQDVEIHDDVPAGTQLVNTTPKANRGPRGELIWTVGAIKPNDEVTVQLELMPTTEGEIGSVATVRFASSVSARTTCTRPELVVEVGAPREVLIGEDYNLAIKVSNPGTGVAAGVVLSEFVPAGFEHPAGAELEYEIGDLRPNETREVELSLKAVKAGATVNRLTVKGEGPLQATKESSVTVVAPALEVTLEGARRRFLDRQAVYTVAISNPGTAAAREVSLAAQLPPGLEFVEANNAGQYDPRTRTVHWLLEELPARELGKVTLTTLPTEQGDLPLKIASTAERGLSVEKQEMIRVEGIAALVFQVVDLADPIDVNGETTYEIRVANQGSKAAENVQVVAMLPQELKPLAADGPSRHDIAGQQVTFQPLARLAPKNETIYTVRAQALRAGDVKISVQLKSSDQTTPVVKEEATRVLSDQ